jgi:hypothetical protein
MSEKEKKHWQWMKVRKEKAKGHKKQWFFCHSAGSVVTSIHRQSF